MYVIILDMLQLDVEEEEFKTIMQTRHLNKGTFMDIALLAICLVTKPLIAIGGI